MKTLLFYNCVINDDLFELIRFYVRYKRVNVGSYDNLTLDEWKQLGTQAVAWAHEVLASKITRPDIDCEHDADGWTPLYYMMLSYANEYRVGQPTIHCLTLEELRSLADDTVEWLKRLCSEIREVNDNDLNEI